MQQPAWRAEFRSLNRPPRRILHAVQKYAVLARGGGGGPGAAALDLDSEKEPLGPWRDSDVRVGFFFTTRAPWLPSWFPRPLPTRQSALCQAPAPPRAHSCHLPVNRDAPPALSTERTLKRTRAPEDCGEALLAPRLRPTSNDMLHICASLHPVYL